jgi:general stress protein 26
MQLLYTIIRSQIKEQQVVSFATIEGQQPRVRPMSLIHLENRFYMITGARGGRDAEKLKQLRVNPRFEYYLTLEGSRVNGFIRGSGLAHEVDDEPTRRKVYDAVEWARGYFPTVEHPDYVLLELEHDGFSYRSPDDMEIKYLKL